MKKHHINRRQLGFWCAGALAAASHPVQAQSKRPFLADMHSHYGMFLPHLFGLDLHRPMRETGTTLLAWSVTDDNRWITRTPRGLAQVAQPEPGELWDNFQSRLAGYESRLRGWNIPKVLNAADVDAAIAGQPYVLLATEAANFLEGRPERVAQAHAWGVRHTPLLEGIFIANYARIVKQAMNGGLKT